MVRYGVMISLNLSSDDENLRMRGFFDVNESTGSFRGAIKDSYHNVVRQICGKINGTYFGMYILEDDLGISGVGGMTSKNFKAKMDLKYIYYLAGLDSRPYYANVGVSVTKLSGKPKEKVEKYTNGINIGGMIPFKEECTPDNRRIIYDLWAQNIYAPVRASSISGAEHSEFESAKHEPEPEPEPEFLEEPEVKDDSKYEYI